MPSPTRGIVSRAARHAGAFATLAFIATVLGFGAALEGYSQRLHPVGLLGAAGVPRAAAFNALALVLPGLLAAIQAWASRSALAARAPALARIGWQMVLLSALAFALQGALPLDPGDLDGAGSRLHASAWVLWWVAFVPGALLLAAAAWRARPRRAVRFVGHLLAAASVLGLVLSAERWLGAGVAQRLAFVAWFGWLALSPLFTDERM